MVMIELTKFEFQALKDLVAKETSWFDTGDKKFENAIRRIEKKLLVKEK